jgi:spoIIIJ-associated protein
MTQPREFNAETVEDAVRKASESLGLPASDLSYEVLDPGSEGFLGIGARDARIAVQAPDTEGFAEAPDASDESGDESGDEIPEGEPVAVSSEVETEEEDELASPPPSADLSEVYGESDEDEDVPAPGELLDEIRNLVTSLLDAMGFEARIDVYDAAGYIAVDVASDSTALFIGQKGETIDAVQYLVNAAIYRKRPFVKRVVLDAEGYRQRRVEAIQGIAHRTARRAVRERRAVELPPMSPAERRVVHIYLRDNPSVTTASEGTGDNRRVRISPS